MTKGRGGGQTPVKLVELINKAIAQIGQSCLEQETGLSHSMISRYKRGQGEPSTKTLQKLADYFGVSIWELRGEVNSEDLNIERIRIMNLYQGMLRGFLEHKGQIPDWLAQGLHDFAKGAIDINASANKPIDWIIKEVQDTANQVLNKLSDKDKQQSGG